MDKEREYRDSASITPEGAPAARQDIPDRPQSACAPQQGAAPMPRQGTPEPQPQNQQQQWQQQQWQQPVYAAQNQPAQGQPAQSQPLQGQPQYGQPQYGQPQYGQPQGYRTATQPTAAAGQNGGAQSAIAVKKENRRPASARDMVYAVIAAVSCIFTADFIFWSGTGIGVSAVSVIMYAATVIYLMKRKKHYGVYTALLNISFVLMAASLTFSDNSFAKFLSVSTMTAVYAATVTDMAGLRRSRAGSLYSVGDLCYTAFALTFGRIGRGTWALFHRKGENGGRAAGRKTGFVLLGVALAIPVLCIVVPLLISSDAAFEGLLKKITFRSFWEVAGALILGLFLFILLFSQAFCAPDTNVKKREERDGRGVDPVVTASFSVAVSVAYVLYLISQLAYFFNAFSGILQEGFTVAQYARRGFFEMSAICVINLAVVFTVSLITRKKEGKVSAAVRLPSLFICLFSLLLIATALSKMVMYIGSYGMTQLRIYTSLFMVFLAVVFVFVILRLFVRNTPYMKAVLVSAALIIAAAGFADTDRVIASYNVNAYLDGRLPTVDMTTLENLDSDAVVPYVAMLVDDRDEEVSTRAMEILIDRFYENFEIKSDNNVTVNPEYKGDFRSFNVPGYKAKELLLKDWQKYYNFEVNNDGVRY